MKPAKKTAPARKGVAKKGAAKTTAKKKSAKKMGRARTEFEKMVAGLPYTIMDPELKKLRRKAHLCAYTYNRSDPMEGDPPSPVLRNLFGSFGAEVFIETPFRCAYGVNIHLGDGAYLNTGCVILDCARVEIGAKALLGPAVQIYTAIHPLDPRERAAHIETAKPVTIGANAWIGGAAVILPGVTVGENAVVGAGSVVTKDVPANTVVAGNPARVIREIAPDGKR
jgi:maltose O-acetyltransferase